MVNSLNRSYLKRSRLKCPDGSPLFLVHEVSPLQRFCPFWCFFLGHTSQVSHCTASESQFCRQRPTLHNSCSVLRISQCRARRQMELRSSSKRHVRSSHKPLNLTKESLNLSLSCLCLLIYHLHSHFGLALAAFSSVLFLQMWWRQDDFINPFTVMFLSPN